MADYKKEYLELLCSKLVEFYHLTPQEAKEAVWSSATEKMMHDEGAADWQMHQPIMFTVEQIYCEYNHLEVPE